MIYCFGDSWGAGAGLNENENPFGYWLAKDLGTKFLNFSREGNSYPVIVTQILDNIRFKYLNRYVIEEAQIKSGPFAGGMPRALTIPAGEKLYYGVVPDFRRDTEIRIDYVQHALCAWIQYYDIVYDEE